VRVERILSYATAQARSSTLDGPSHWHRVASFGAQLCRATPGADLRVVSLFAVLHDAQRYTDGRDPEHGRRAAELALDLQGVLFKVTDERLNLLVEAIAKHADGLSSYRGPHHRLLLGCGPAGPPEMRDTAKPSVALDTCGAEKDRCGLRREYRNLTRAELASITSSRPVVRKIESSSRDENPGPPGARKNFYPNRKHMFAPTE
jgi:hypothetical protein